MKKFWGRMQLYYFKVGVCVPTGHLLPSPFALRYVCFGEVFIMVNLMLLSMPPWSRTLHMSHQKLLLQFSFCCPLFSLCFVFLLSFVLLFSFVFLDYILAPFYAVYNRQYLAVV